MNGTSESLKERMCLRASTSFKSAWYSASCAGEDYWRGACVSRVKVRSPVQHSKEETPQVIDALIGARLPPFGSSLRAKATPVCFQSTEKKGGMRLVTNVDVESAGTCSQML